MDAYTERRTAVRAQSAPLRKATRTASMTLRTIFPGPFALRNVTEDLPAGTNYSHTRSGIDVPNWDGSGVTRYPILT